MLRLKRASLCVPGAARAGLALAETGASPGRLVRMRGPAVAGLSRHGQVFGRHAVLEQLTQLLAQFRRVMVMVYRDRVLHGNTQ